MESYAPMAFSALLPSLRRSWWILPLAADFTDSFSLLSNIPRHGGSPVYFSVTMWLVSDSSGRCGGDAVNLRVLRWEDQCLHSLGECLLLSLSPSG